MASVAVWESLHASVSEGWGDQSLSEGTDGCVCEERSAKGGYGVVSRL